MTGLRELSLRLVWSAQAQGGDADLLLEFLPGRSQVLSVRRTDGAGPEPCPEPILEGVEPQDAEGTDETGPPRIALAHQRWRLAVSRTEHRQGHLDVQVSYLLAPPVVAGLAVVSRGERPPPAVNPGGNRVARMNARRLAARLLEGDLRETFEWFTGFERRSNDALMEAGGGDPGDEGRAAVMQIIGGCRADLLARLNARAERALSRHLVPRLLRSATFADLAAKHLLGGAPDRAGRRRWRTGLRSLGQELAGQHDLAPLARRECRDRLRFVRDRILDDIDEARPGQGAWTSLEVEEIGRRFRRFAGGRMRMHDQLHELSAEPDSCFFFLFAELAVALSELPIDREATDGEPTQPLGDRLRWRRLAREFVLCEHLFRRAYAPGPSLLIRDFDAYHRANLDRDPRRRTDEDELSRLRLLYAGLDLSKDADWSRILDDHALMVSLTCPGWLRPWRQLADELKHSLGKVTVAARPGGEPRGNAHTVRLFVRHVISAFVELPHGALEGSRTLAELKLTGEALECLAESLRGYVRRLSSGTATVTRHDLQDKTVEQVLELVVERCAVTLDGQGDEGHIAVLGVS